MKARTKAQRASKRRAAANRKDLPRAPSGALSRSTERYRQEAAMTEKEAKVVVMQARQRVHGIGESSAGLAEAGSALGRLYLAGAITKRLYESGNRFAEDVWAYHALTGIPHPSPRAIDYGRVRGLGRDSSPEAVKRAANRYMNVLGVIQQCDRAGRPIETTLRNVVLLDMDASNWPLHMINILRKALTALAEWYGIPVDEPKEGGA